VLDRSLATRHYSSALFAEIEDVISSTNSHDTFQISFIVLFRRVRSAHVRLPRKQLVARQHPFGTPLAARCSPLCTPFFLHNTTSATLQFPLVFAAKYYIEYIFNTLAYV
jgi:hypothetical protein